MAEYIKLHDAIFAKLKAIGCDRNVHVQLMVGDVGDGITIGYFNDGRIYKLTYAEAQTYLTALSKGETRKHYELRTQA